MFNECRDQGAEFLEAQVNCNLSDILRVPKGQQLKQLFPVELGSPEAAFGALLQVQATFFRCGGMAIGLCISHKIADAATLSTFIKSWCEVSANKESDSNLFELCSVAKMFPPKDVPLRLPATEPESSEPHVKNVMKRLVFDAQIVAALKANAASTCVPNPSRVEAVSAFIWKCLLDSKLGLDVPKTIALCTTVNLRKRMVPSLPERSIGNVVSTFQACAENQLRDRTGQEEDEMGEELQELVRRTRKYKEDSFEKYAKRLIGNEASFSVIGEILKEVGDLMGNDDVDLYFCTSWCRFGFYEADFGWGKPIWACMGNGVYNSYFRLMDTRDGDGIEVWIVLKEEDMDLLVSHKKLREFASMNPSVL